MRIGNALRSPFSRSLLVTALVAVIAVAIGLGITFVAAQRGSETRDCELGGSASFAEARSISHLASRADAVIKGKVKSVGRGQDQYSDRPPPRVPYVMSFVVYDIVLEEVLSGAVPEGKSEVSVGASYTLCLDTGATYYMFVHNENVAGGPYVDSKNTFQNPADYSLASFGPANVMELRSGKVVFLGMVGDLAPGSTMDEAEFRKLLRENQVLSPRE